MHLIGLRRVAILFALMGLVLATFPASAAPQRTTHVAGVEVALVRVLPSWLVWVMPGASSAKAVAVQQRLSGDIDPDGGQKNETGGPTGEPELGGDIDPDG